MTLYPKANTWFGGTGTADELDIGTSLGKSTVSDKQRRTKERESSGRLTGRITMFSIEKNFGFIVCGRDSYYFSRSALGPELDYVISGENVQFDLEIDRKGRTLARNVTLV